MTVTCDQWKDWVLDVWKCGWHSVVIQTYWIWIDRFLSLQTLSQLMRPSISPQDSVESWNTSPSQSRVWRLRAFLLQWKMCWRRFWPHHHLRLVALQRKDFKTSKIESNRIKPNQIKSNRIIEGDTHTHTHTHSLTQCPFAMRFGLRLWGSFASFREQLLPGVGSCRPRCLGESCSVKFSSSSCRPCLTIQIWNSVMAFEQCCHFSAAFCVQVQMPAQQMWKWRWAVRVTMCWP